MYLEVKSVIFQIKPRPNSNIYPQQNGVAFDYLKNIVECVQRKDFIIN